MIAKKGSDYVLVPYLPELSHLLLGWLVTNKKAVMAELGWIRRDGDIWIIVRGLPDEYDEKLVEYINTTVL